MYTDIINTALSYKRILYTEVAYTNCFISSLNIFINNTPVFSFGALFTHPFINKKPYYNNGLFLNKSINLTNIGL